MSRPVFFPHRVPLPVFPPFSRAFGAPALPKSEVVFSALGAVSSFDRIACLTGSAPAADRGSFECAGFESRCHFAKPAQRSSIASTVSPSYGTPSSGTAR